MASQAASISSSGPAVMAHSQSLGKVSIARGAVQQKRINTHSHTIHNTPPPTHMTPKPGLTRFLAAKCRQAGEPQSWPAPHCQYVGLTSCELSVDRNQTVRHQTDLIAATTQMRPCDGPQKIAMKINEELTRVRGSPADRDAPNGQTIDPAPAIRRPS